LEAKVLVSLGCFEWRGGRWGLGLAMALAAGTLLHDATGGHEEAQLRLQLGDFGVDRLASLLEPLDGRADFLAGSAVCGIKKLIESSSLNKLYVL
jgi:hypothetical protein